MLTEDESHRNRNFNGHKVRVGTELRSPDCKTICYLPPILKFSSLEIFSEDSSGLLGSQRESRGCFGSSTVDVLVTEILTMNTKPWAAFLAFPADTWLRHVWGSTFERSVCSRVRACGLEMLEKKNRYKRNRDTG